MTPDLRTMLLRRIQIDIRPVHDRSLGSLPPIPSPTSVSPNEPEKIVAKSPNLGDRDPPNLTVEANRDAPVSPEKRVPHSPPRRTPIGGG